jgi:putative NADH-flavin reductase
MILIAKNLRIFVAGVCVCVCVCGVGVKLTPGQLVVASLMERGHSVRAIIRNPEKGKALFGDQDPQQFQVSPLDQQLFT